MNITEFIGNIRKHPLLIPNRYKVHVTGPLIAPTNLTLNVTSLSIPNRSVATMDRYIKGPSTKVPYVEIFDDLTITFRLSADMVERAFFDQWIDFMGGQFYSAAYFDDIKGKIIIEVYHLNDQKMRTYEFFDVFPLSVSETSMSEDSEEIATSTVQFAYHHYESQ